MGADGERLVAHGDGDLGLHGLAVKRKFGLVQLHVAFLQRGGLGRLGLALRRLVFLLYDGERNFYGAGVAGGRDAFDDHPALTHFGIVLVGQVVVLVQGQQGVLHPDGNVGADFLAGVLVLGFLQTDVVGCQLGELGVAVLCPGGQGSSGKQRQGQHRAQPAPQKGCAHIGFPPWLIANRRAAGLAKS